MSPLALTVIIGTTRSEDLSYRSEDETWPLAAPTVPVLDRLPTPPAKMRWVGPLAPIVEPAGFSALSPWAGLAPGGERTACYSPCELRGPADSRTDGWAETDTSGRPCVRTGEGWWVAVPADRPSGLAAHVAEVNPAAVEVDQAGRRRPVRDACAEVEEATWDGGRMLVGRPAWRAHNLLLVARRGEHGNPAGGVEVAWCPFRPGSRAWHDTMTAAGVRL